MQIISGIQPNSIIFNLLSRYLSQNADITIKFIKTIRIEYIILGIMLTLPFSNRLIKIGEHNINPTIETYINLITMFS